MERADRAQELCESRGGRPGLPVPNNPYGLCGCRATLNQNLENADTTLTLSGAECRIQIRNDTFTHPRVMSSAVVNAALQVAHTATGNAVSAECIKT